MNQNNFEIPELVQIVIGLLLFALLINIATPSETTQNYSYPGECVEIGC